MASRHRPRAAVQKLVKALVLASLALGLARVGAFVAAPGRPRPDRHGRVVGLTAPALLAGAAPGLMPGPAGAWEISQLGNPGRFLATVWDSLLGPVKDADPYSDEGAKALGLAMPIPRQMKEQQVGFEDVLPFLGFFVLLCIWGLAVVPSTMDRSDGAKSVLFPSQVPKLKPFVPDEIRMLPPEAPILPSRRLKDPNSGVLLPKKSSAAKKQQGKSSKKKDNSEGPKSGLRPLDRNLARARSSHFVSGRNQARDRSTSGFVLLQPCLPIRIC